MSAMMLKSVPGQKEQREARQPRRRQARENRERVNVALQHAKDDVDGDDRSQNEERLAGQRLVRMPLPHPQRYPPMLAGIDNSSLALDWR